MIAPVWSASYLAFVLPLTPEQVLQPANGLPNCTGATVASRREWVWIQTAQRLTWMYGFDGALARLQSYREVRAAA